MENQELFKLRKKGYLEFNTPKETIAKLEDIMKDSQIPLVVGYKDFDPEKNWEVVYLNPQELSDKLTIETFLEGLRKVKDSMEELRKFKDMKQDFHGMIIYKGEVMCDLEEGDLILNLFIGKKGDSSRRYELNVTLGKNQTYNAKANISVPKFEQIIEKHLGPNK